MVKRITKKEWIKALEETAKKKKWGDPEVCPLCNLVYDTVQKEESIEDYIERLLKEYNNLPKKYREVRKEICVDFCKKCIIHKYNKDNKIVITRIIYNYYIPPCAVLYDSWSNHPGFCKRKWWPSEPKLIEKILKWYKNYGKKQ